MFAVAIESEDRRLFAIYTQSHVVFIVLTVFIILLILFEGIYGPDYVILDEWYTKVAEIYPRQTLISPTDKQATTRFGSRDVS